MTRVSVSLGDASDRRSALVGIHEDQTFLAKGWRVFYAPGNFGRRNANEIQEPVGSSRKSTECGQRMWTTIPNLQFCIVLQRYLFIFRVAALLNI